MLKENEGRISYEDLEGMGVFKPGDLAEGGFKRWLQEHDIGGPANFDKLLSKEYKLTQAETSFAELSQEEQRKRSQEWAMLLAMAAMPAIDTALHGRSETIYGNNVFDNLERQGTQGSYKGSTTSWKPPVEERTVKYFDDIQLKTEPNKSYFWSGLGETGASTAANIAGKNGGVTLETTIEVQGVKMPKWDFNNPSAVETWKNASSAYARQASGEVRAVIGSSVKPDSIWNTIELPALKANPNVTKIITVDPITLTETIIFMR